MKKAESSTLRDQEISETTYSFDKLPNEVHRLSNEIKEIKNLLLSIKPEAKPIEPKRSISSITELAKFLGVARCTAHALKKSGRIPFIQYGRKLVIDPDKVLISLNGYSPKRRKVPTDKVKNS